MDHISINFPICQRTPDFINTQKKEQRERYSLPVDQSMKMVRSDPTGHLAPEVPHLNYFKRTACFPTLRLCSLFLVEDNGFEPLTPCVQGRCSSQLS